MRDFLFLGSEGRSGSEASESRWVFEEDVGADAGSAGGGTGGEGVGETGVGTGGEGVGGQAEGRDKGTEVGAAAG